MSAWKVTHDLGLTYIQHTPSLDMLILDQDGAIIEDDLSGRKVPEDVRVLALAGRI